MDSQMLSMGPQSGFTALNNEWFGAAKVMGSPAAATQSRSTSAGSSPSQDSAKPREDMPQSSFSPSFYATDALGLPEYDYPTPWSLEQVPQLPGDNYPSALIMKNTFLGTKVPRSLSLEEYFEERNTQSCPVSAIGLPPGLEEHVFEDMAEVHAMMQPADCLPADLFQDDQLGYDDMLGFASPEYDYLQALPQQDPSWYINEEFSMHGEFSMNGQFSPLEAQPFVLDLMQALDAPFEAAQAQQSQQVDAQFASFAVSEQHSSGPELGSAECPTVGSQAHWAGTCKPCAFLYTKGCGNGANCSFCHLCGPGEKKRRAKGARSMRRGPE